MRLAMMDTMPRSMPSRRVPVTVQSSTDDGLAVVSVPASGIDLDAVERALIAFAIQTTDGNRTRAAQWLHLTRSALLYRLQKYGLTTRGRS